jgi:TIR domain
MPQGIFISYRRDDTGEFARTLHEALAAALPRKKLFLDVKMSEPGVDIIDKIKRELMSTQVVLVVIGPQWNAGNRLQEKDDFVRRELKLALDLKRQQKIAILPILTGGAYIPRNSLPADIADLADLEYLIIENEQGIQHVIDRTKELLPPYWIANRDDITYWGWDFVDLLRQLVRMDTSEIPAIELKPRNPVKRILFQARRFLELTGFIGEDPGDEGTPEQWAVIFNRHPQTWRLILNSEDEIVAYWHVAPLKNEEYRKLLAGHFKAGMVTYDKLSLFESKSNVYNLFFVITVISELHRTIAVRRQLFYSFFEVLDQLASAAEPVFVGEVAADVWTPEGIKLAEGFGMRRVGQRADDPNVLIYSVRAIEMLSSFPALREKYLRAEQEKYLRADSVLADG